MPAAFAMAGKNELVLVGGDGMNVYPGMITCARVSADGALTMLLLNGFQLMSASAAGTIG